MFDDIKLNVVDIEEFAYLRLFMS